MVRASRVAPCLFLAAVIPTLIAAGLDARNISYVDELFQSIERQPLDAQEWIALRALRNRIRHDAARSSMRGSEQQQSQIDQVMLCAAGLLDERQFLEATGSKKTPRQQLRYELKQLRIEILRLEHFTRHLQRQGTP